MYPELVWQWIIYILCSAKDCNYFRLIHWAGDTTSSRWSYVRPLGHPKPTWIRCCYSRNISRWLLRVWVNRNNKRTNLRAITNNQSMNSRQSSKHHTSRIHPLHRIMNWISRIKSINPYHISETIQDSVGTTTIDVDGTPIEANRRSARKNNTDGSWGGSTQVE